MKSQPRWDPARRTQPKFSIIISTGGKMAPIRIRSISQFVVVPPKKNFRQGEAPCTPERIKKDQIIESFKSPNSSNCQIVHIVRNEHNARQSEC